MFDPAFSVKITCNNGIIGCEDDIMPEEGSHHRKR